MARARPASGISAIDLCGKYAKLLTMDDQTQALIARADAYAERAGLSLTTVSQKVLGNTQRLNDLKAGKETYLRPPTIRRAMEKMTALERDESSVGAEVRQIDGASAA